MPRDLPELNITEARPSTQTGKHPNIKMKKPSEINSQTREGLSQEQALDDRMSKIATTLNRLNRQLQLFQEDLEARQRDPLVQAELSAEANCQEYLEDEDADYLIEHNIEGGHTFSKGTEHHSSYSEDLESVEMFINNN